MIGAITENPMMRSAAERAGGILNGKRAETEATPKGEGGGEYFTPEEPVTIKKVDTTPPTGERRALTGESEKRPTFSESIITTNQTEVNETINPTEERIKEMMIEEINRLEEEEVVSLFLEDWDADEEGQGPVRVTEPEADDGWDEIVVEEIGRSVGAKAKNYKVYNPITEENMYLTEGTRITQPKDHIIAGKGRERQIDELPLLIDRWGGDPLEWTKEKGFGYVDDEYGDSHRVEIHWYIEMMEIIRTRHRMMLNVLE